MFGDRRWIDVQDPNLLNYENIQVLLIGPRKKDLEEELGIRDSAEVAIALGELKGGKKFRRAKQIEAADQPGKRGGKAAATESISLAAAIAKVLSGIDFPKTKDSLKQYARNNISNVEVKSNAILKVIDQLPDRKYDNMAEV